MVRPQQKYSLSLFQQVLQDQQDLPDLLGLQAQLDLLVQTVQTVQTEALVLPAQQALPDLRVQPPDLVRLLQAQDP